MSIEILNDSERIPSDIILPFDEDPIASLQRVVVDILVMCIMHPQNFINHIHQRCGDRVLLVSPENL